MKDIFPGADGSVPVNLTKVNDTLFFRANDGIAGSELWKSDGTPGGTVLVKDINPGAGGSAPDNLTDVNGTLFFRARDEGSTGRELWKSDGTAAGTVLVKDIHPGPGASFPSPSPFNLTNVDGTLFFRADDGSTGQELWKSDGTAAGTLLVKDIFPGTSFDTGDPNSSSPGGLIDVDGTLFFHAADGDTGRELWRSDGTAAGTLLVEDIFPGAVPSSTPTELTNVNGTLFFRAEEGSAGGELWKSDGTAAGTVLVKDIFPGVGDSNPRNLTNVKGVLFFSAFMGVRGGSGRELWSSDGTATGTVLVKDIFTGVGNSSPGRLMEIGEQLLFRADDGQVGDELWALTRCGDGTLDPGEQCDGGSLGGGGCCSPTCEPQPAGSACTDGNACTEDTCDGEGVCRSVTVGFPGARAVFVRGLEVDACAGQPVPRLVIRLFDRARTLVERAEGASQRRAKRLVRSAVQRLKKGKRPVGRAGRHVVGECAATLGGRFAEALSRAECLLTTL